MTAASQTSEMNKDDSRKQEFQGSTCFKCRKSGHIAKKKRPEYWKRNQNIKKTI